VALWLDGAEAIGAERARRELDLLVVEKPLNMAASQDNTGGGGGERAARSCLNRLSTHHVRLPHVTTRYLCPLCHASICISRRKGVRHPNAPLAALRCAAGRTVRARWMPNGQC